jgi:hypothetical protein
MNHAVYVIDPKSDEWASSVLWAACEAAGVPFTYIDLTAPIPQMNLLHGIGEHDLEALFIEGFELARQHDKYDFFRIFERLGAEMMAQAAAQHMPCALPDLQRVGTALLQQSGMSDDRGLGFKFSLRELSRVRAFATRNGARLHEPLATGGCFYIRGSVTHDGIVNAQRMLLLRIAQIISARPRGGRHVTVFADDTRFTVGKIMLDTLAVIRDKGCNLVLAFTSLRDVNGAILDNTGIKCAYRAADPSVAEYMRKLGGNIVARERHLRVERNSALRDLQLGEHSEREREYPLISDNVALSLPNGTCAIYGLGTARIGMTCPIRVEKRTPQLPRVAKPASEGANLLPPATHMSFHKNGKPPQPPTIPLPGRRVV